MLFELLLEPIRQTGMDALASQPKVSALKYDVRQTAVVITIGMLLGTALFVTGGYLTTKQRAVAPEPGVAQTQTDAEIYTGSILYMPDEGRVCHQLLFQNLTGRFVDNGYVDCLGAAYLESEGPPKRMSTARVKVISSGFREH
jgi:hypothetical protein